MIAPQNAGQEPVYDTARTARAIRLLADLSWDPCLARLGLGTQLVALNSVPTPIAWLFWPARGRVRPAGPAGLGRVARGGA
jgi:hypothetical protein